MLGRGKHVHHRGVRRDHDLLLYQRRDVGERLKLTDDHVRVRRVDHRHQLRDVLAEDQERGRLARQCGHHAAERLQVGRRVGDLKRQLGPAHLGDLVDDELEGDSDTEVRARATDRPNSSVFSTSLARTSVPSASTISTARR